MIFFPFIFLFHFRTDSNLNDNLSPSEIDWVTSEWLCEKRSPPGNAGPDTTGTKGVMSKRRKWARRGKNSEVEKRAFKRLENDKETGSRRDNVSKGARNARKLGLLKLLTFSTWKQLMTTDRYRWQKVWHLMLKDFPLQHHFDNQRKWANITQFNLNRAGGGGGERQRVKTMKRLYCWLVEPQDT